ncbi:restriction endonuclease subunit S [Xanthomarina gelatinilytica]|uniref:restriction endonuclease subunit S n=1 Tax=Xanthomarina gelatinilytica TaxID=1137281 RepID=UPI003AA98949
MFSIDKNINTDSAFLIKRSLIENRLEPKFYTSRYLNNVIKIKHSKLPVYNLSEITDLISDGTHFTPIYTDKGVKFISVKDVRKSEINLEKTKYISIEEADRLDRRCKPQLNDVLLTKIGTIGLASVIETKERFQIFVSVALLRPNNKVLPKYLEIFLNSKLAFIQFERVLKGSGVPDLHLEDIRKVKIPLPSVEEQNKIVSLYLNAYNERQNKEQEAKLLLQSIDEFLLSELGIDLPKRDNSFSNRVFEVNWSELSGDRFDAFSFFNNELKIEGGNFPNKKLRELATVNKGQSITSANVIEGDYSVIAGGKTSPYSHNEYNNEGKTITVSASGAYSGYVWYHNEKIFASDCAVIKSKDEKIISMDYLAEILKLKQTEIYGLQQGAGQPHVYPSDLVKLNIPVPPLHLQNRITEHIFELREKAKQLESESKSLLKEAKSKIEKMIIG